MLEILKKIIPKKIFKTFQPAYHFLLSWFGAVLFGFPARKLFVIGVTGTKGKSTVTEIVNAILEEAGNKTALSGTIRFKIGKASRPNLFKMSMPGRFFMQKFLHDAVKAGCTHVVLEITSEGARQFRNKFIDLDALIFTNIAPEHIESHGSFEKYKEAKLNIARELEKSRKQKTVLVVNADDATAEDFLKINAQRKITYSLSETPDAEIGDEISFTYLGEKIISPLRGEFNLMNLLSALKLTTEMGIALGVQKSAIAKLSVVPGRVQFVNAGQEFDVVVDYAHTADSLEALYKSFPTQRKICVLGNCGGGRDKWKRPVMAKMAEKYCDQIILTDEDPYDDNPMEIVEDMKAAISEKPAQIVIDRRDAIAEAIRTAKAPDVILITGKGTDPYIMRKNGQKLPWSDYKIAEEELLRFLNK